MTDLECTLLALLDRIEVEEDYSLAVQRFDIAEDFGYTIEITGILCSSAMN